MSSPWLHVVLIKKAALDVLVSNTYGWRAACSATSMIVRQKSFATGYEVMIQFLFFFTGIIPWIYFQPYAYVTELTFIRLHIIKFVCIWKVYLCTHTNSLNRLVKNNMVFIHMKCRNAMHDIWARKVRKHVPVMINSFKRYLPGSRTPWLGITPKDRMNGYVYYRIELPS